MKEITLLDIQKMRLINNGCIQKFKTCEECVHNLLGIQSQYQNYAIVSLYNRVKQFNIQNLFDSDNLIKSWGHRTTLHIYHKDDYNLISDTYINIPNWVSKYAKILNIDYKEYLNYIVKELEKKEYLTKREIENILPKEFSKKIMQWSGLLILATYEKVLYGILNKKDEKLYVKNDIPNNIGKKEILVLNYFKYYGPATIDDFLHWSGLRKSDIDKHLYLLNTLNNFKIFNKNYYYVGDIINFNEYDFQYPIILGKFDPLLVCYKDKNWIMGNYDSKLVWKEAGQIEGVILFKKGIVASWHYKILNKSKILFIVKQIKKVNISEKKSIMLKFKEMLICFEQYEFDIIYE